MSAGAGLVSADRHSQSSIQEEYHESVSAGRQYRGLRLLISLLTRKSPVYWRTADMLQRREVETIVSAARRYSTYEGRTGLSQIIQGLVEVARTVP